MMIKEILTKEWLNSGVCEGDVLLVHSSLKRTFERYAAHEEKLSPQIILESFLDAVGESGTLLLPLFNFDFAKGIPFDIRRTPSQMGALSEAGRLHPQAVRTGHPIYSFAVIGAKADKFKDVDNYSGYAADSPFGILRELDGKSASLNMPEGKAMTFFHHAEQMNNVPYRYHEEFTGEYTDENGKTEIRTYGLLVRDLEKGVITDAEPIEKLMWEKGLYDGYLHNEGSGLKTILANKMFDFASDIITSGRAEGMLYRINGKKS